MAFILDFIITSRLGAELKHAVLAEAALRWPSIRLPLEKQLESASQSAPAPSQHLLANHACFAIDGEHAQAESVAAELSMKFPTIVFVHIAVECFGGNCEHEGSVWRNGQVSHREVFDDDPSSHRRQLEHVGIMLSGEYFVPFVRQHFRSE